MIRFPLACVVVLAAATLALDVYPKNYAVDMLNYAFHITLSDETDVIEGRAEISVKFVEAGQRTVRLDLIEQDSDGNGMAVSEVLVDGSAVVFRHEDDQVFIDLPTPSVPDQHTVVSVSYSGVPITGLIIGPNKYGDRTFFSDNWPNRARNWLPTVDHPYDKASNELSVTAPEHYQIASNGLQIEETNLDGGRKLTHWKNSVPIATWLYSLAAAEFAVQRVGDFQGKEIQTWVYKQDRDAGFYDFAVPTPHALQYYTDYVGPYAYERLANIQSNSVGGGMEAASSIFYGDRSVTGRRDVRWRNVIIHEVAHQWFGNAVTEADWDDVWLSESFATYFTLLFREHAYGREDFVEGLKQHREGVWNYYQENGGDFRIVHDNLDPIERGTVTTYQVTYLRGAWVLHMLRNLVGDEAWWTGIQSYYKEFYNANATTADFKRHMEAASGQDLTDFFRQWLHRGGHVVLEGGWTHKDGILEIHLQQVQDDPTHFDIQVEVGTYRNGADMPSIDKINLPGRVQANIRVPVEGIIDRIVLDPRTVLLANWTFERR